MKHNPLQLSLIPELKTIPAVGGKTYVLVQVAESYHKAKEIAEYVRKNGCSARIEKDKDGKHDEPGTYLIWARQIIKAVGVAIAVSKGFKEI